MKNLMRTLKKRQQRKTEPLYFRYGNEKKNETKSDFARDEN